MDGVTSCQRLKRSLKFKGLVCNGTNEVSMCILKSLEIFKVFIPDFNNKKEPF